MTIARILLVLLTMSPRDASHVAARVIGRPELGARLEAICERESKCLPIGVHRGDAGNSRRVFENARRRGYLCELHEYAPGRWSTRGAWGTMAGYTLRYLPGVLQCLPPEALDVTLIGAIAAAFRLAAVDERSVPAHKAWARPGFFGAFWLDELERGAA